MPAVAEDTTKDKETTILEVDKASTTKTKVEIGTTPKISEVTALQMMPCKICFQAWVECKTPTPSRTSHHYNQILQTQCQHQSKSIQNPTPSLEQMAKSKKQEKRRATPLLFTNSSS